MFDRKTQNEQDRGMTMPDDKKQAPKRIDQFFQPQWTSGANVTIREVDASTLSKTGTTYAASANFNPSLMLKLLNSPKDLAELKRVCSLAHDNAERKAMIDAASEKKAERAIAEVVKDAKSAVKLCRDKMIDTAKRDEILATLKADNPSAVEAIDKLLAN